MVPAAIIFSAQAPQSIPSSMMLIQQMQIQIFPGAIMQNLWLPGKEKQMYFLPILME